MDDVGAELLRWGVPVAVGVVVVAVVVLGIRWAVRRARRSPARRASAEAARTAAGGALVRLDDAVGELELDSALSGGDAPAELRRARMTAQHARDRAFADYAALTDPALLPGDVRRRAVRIAADADDALARIGRTRAAAAVWIRDAVPLPAQLAAARARLAELRAAMGDPAGLVRELSARFDESEWRDAATAARETLDAADDAGRHLDAASAGDTIAHLAAAERSLRSARADERTLEETHRLVTQAASALTGEFEAIEGALGQAAVVRSHLAAESTAALDEATALVRASLDELAPVAARRPTAAVDRIARLRVALDAALGDAATSQQRVRGARTALPGTLASARTAIARAETAVAHASAGADARVRLAAAASALAEARTAQDPLSALAAARRALTAADEAAARADLDRAAAKPAEIH